MNIIKANKINKTQKNKRTKDYFFYLSLIICCFVFLLCLNLSTYKFSKDFLQSLKTTIQTLKPTDELFDDNGGVKLVSILFPTSPQQVNNQILNFKFKLDFYDSCASNNGVITLYNPSGIIYANESGKISINKISDDFDELKITHALGTETVYSGKFIFGVVDNQIIEKGEPLAVVLSNKLEFFITHNDEIISNLTLIQGEIAWKD